MKDFSQPKEQKLKEVIDKLRAQVRNLEDDKAQLIIKSGELKKEIMSLKAEIDKRLPIAEVKDADARKLLEELQGKVRKLDDEKKDLAQRLAEKEASNGKIANLCNILLQDKASIVETNKKLAESLEQMRNTTKQLEEANKKLQERMEETRKSLGIDQLKVNF